ncbi:MAG: nuclear transport factor 2 family protein [Novosphingobium sp.]|uniref:nuclear transport factor 2 family protein n=1 Tax=Novosphingobium sp. TaxID=1874826 RepID=UPI001DC58BD9|nr:nuclear transport factor 2 family protein [Novosphingobium sp.]MCB2056765.1 nuclear transport factor 2 family protein [Novosphingobium sp.]MCP5387152.1 nuclear transport factor 2 family protein [Novosphingobium sp.]
MSGAAKGVAAWHAFMAGGSDPAVLVNLLADDAVFHSPVVHSPQAGKAKVMMYLTAAGQVLGNQSFRYVREVIDGANVCLEFTAEIDGITINGIDLIQFGDDGKIRDFKVMVRPIKAVNKLWELMAAQLQAAG